MVRVYDCHTCRRSHTKISPLSRAALSLFLRARRPQSKRRRHRHHRARASVRSDLLLSHFTSGIYCRERAPIFTICSLSFARTQTGAAKFAINIHSAPNRARFRRSLARSPRVHIAARAEAKEGGRPRLIRAQQITACRLARKTAGVLLRRPLAPLDEPAD